MHRRIAFTLLMAGTAVWGQPAGMRVPPQASGMRSESAVVLPDALKGIGIEQKLNNQLPLDALFRDETGRTVRLGSYFGSKPVLLALVYFECPMLCTQVLNGMESSLKVVTLNPGRDFEVVAVSFDPKDTPELAEAKKANYLRRYGRAGTESGWHFLTGDAASIKALTEAVGFHYRWDEPTKQFVHASGIMVATPQGRLSHYFYGVDYSARDVRLALVESATNKIGNPVDQLLLFCYHYDPATGKYGAIAMNMVRLGGAVFVLFGGGLLLLLWRRDVFAQRRSTSQA
ncbi:MAG TPA: SCO family protein [Bryobacteraceae bacterium]|nr:SCO family protein [Bryobacteraceae bacterium]